MRAQSCRCMNGTYGSRSRGNGAAKSSAAAQADVSVTDIGSRLQMQKTTLYKSAVIVHALNSLAGVLLPLPALLQGPDAPGILNGVPQVVLVTSALMSVIGLVSAYGAWTGQKWGVWLTILLEVGNGLLALPGVLLAPTNGARISAVIGVLTAAFVVVGLLWQPVSSSKR